MKNITISLVQNRPSRDIDRSLAYLREATATAVAEGAELVVFSESCYHPYELPSVRTLAKEADRALQSLCEMARENNVYLCAGSIFVPEEDGIYNRAHLIDPNGEVILRHDKCHLYDVNFQGLRIRESRFVRPGSRFETVMTPFGRVGMLVCYDIRFPESARALKECDLLLVPAAFNQVSGPAHWHLLFRTRAVENQCYVAACSPARDDDAAYVAYGHSMLIDPWGDVLAEAEEGEELISAALSAERLEEIRGRLPLVDHRRPDIY